MSGHPGYHGPRPPIAASLNTGNFPPPQVNGHQTFISGQPTFVNGPPPAQTVPAAIPTPLIPVLSSANQLHKSTSVYVGKIANTVDNLTMQALLEACGQVKTWKRQEDPDTKQLKGFGFCEFEEAEGVLRATRLLNGLSLDGQELLVKCSSATQKYVEAFEKEKFVKVKAEIEEGETLDSDEMKDNEVLEKVMMIISDREDKKQKAEPKEKISENDGAFNGDISESSSMKKEKRDEYHRERNRENRRGYRSEYHRTLDDEYERMRVHRDGESKRREEDRAFEKRVSEWERHERSIFKEKERDKDIERDLEKERTRHIRADFELMDTDDEKEQWARKPYKNTRRAAERRRKRLEEEHWDFEDSLREEEEKEEEKKAKEAEIKRRKQEEEEAKERQMILEEEEKKRKQLEKEQELQQKEQTDKKIVSDLNDPIYGAIIKEINSTKKISPVSITHLNETKKDQTAEFDVHFSNRLANIFGEEEDDDEKTERKLRLINYSEEELKQGSSINSKSISKKLIDALPKTKEEIYKFNINWNVYNPDALGPKIQEWVSKKISDALGFEEESLTGFIMDQINSHQTPELLEKELNDVLEDAKESETFVMKLYRTIIYETEKAALGY